MVMLTNDGIIAQDRELAAVVAQHNAATRPKSLMEVHAAKKKKAAPDERAVRKPFDRERDLDLGRFDATKRDSMIKSSEAFNAKFSSGAGRKYL